MAQSVTNFMGKSGFMLLFQNGGYKYLIMIAAALFFMQGLPKSGAAGVAAVPMAARVAQKVGQEENPNNYLLMHAMGPNVAGAIGSAVAAGVFLSLFSQ